MAKRDWKTKQCPRCDAEFRTFQGDRFCVDCRKQVKSELEAVGFLRRTPTNHNFRTSDQRQSPFDESGGCGDNAIRAMEGD